MNLFDNKDYSLEDKGIMGAFAFFEDYVGRQISIVVPYVGALEGICVARLSAAAMQGRIVQHFVASLDALNPELPHNLCGMGSPLLYFDDRVTDGAILQHSRDEKGRLIRSVMFGVNYQDNDNPQAQFLSHADFFDASSDIVIGPKAVDWKRKRTFNGSIYLAIPKEGLLK